MKCLLIFYTFPKKQYGLVNEEKKNRLSFSILFVVCLLNRERLYMEFGYKFPVLDKAQNDTIYIHIIYLKNKNQIRHLVKPLKT